MVVKLKSSGICKDVSDAIRRRFSYDLDFRLILSSDKLRLRDNLCFGTVKNLLPFFCTQTETDFFLFKFVDNAKVLRLNKRTLGELIFLNDEDIIMVCR